MKKITLLAELNKSTIEKDEFERALAESGFDLPPEEDEFSDDPEGMGDEMGMEDPEALDSDGEDEIETGGESPLDEDELQDIVDWCEEECGEMSDPELKDTLTTELEELELSEDELDATINQVMSMMGRETDEEGDDEFSDDPEGEMGMEDPGAEDEMGMEEPAEDELTF